MQSSRLFATAFVQKCHRVCSEFWRELDTFCVNIWAVNKYLSYVAACQKKRLHWNWNYSSQTICLDGATCSKIQKVEFSGASKTMDHGAAYGAVPKELKAVLPFCNTHVCSFSSVMSALFFLHAYTLHLSLPFSVCAMEPSPHGAWLHFLQFFFFFFEPRSTFK